MADSEREDSYYHPGGVPVTPQARRLGYEFPVYVSDHVWSKFCASQGIPSKRQTNLELRINTLIQHCYDGMLKKLTQSDDFLSYEFKVWFWRRDKPEARKMGRARLGARLFLDPSTGGPWLYMFEPYVDSIDTLTKGEPDEQIGEAGEAADASSQVVEGARGLPSGPETGPPLREDPTGDSEFGAGGAGDHVGPPEMYK